MTSQKDHFIAEIKQFNVYYSLIMEQIKKSELTKQPEALYKDELQKVDNTKNKLNEIIEGQLDEVVQPLINEYQADLLAELGGSQFYYLPPAVSEQGCAVISGS